MHEGYDRATEMSTGSTKALRSKILSTEISIRRMHINVLTNSFQEVKTIRPQTK